jgi:hypothetical protein
VTPTHSTSIIASPYMTHHLFWLSSSVLALFVNAFNFFLVFNLNSLSLNDLKYIYDIVLLHFFFTFLLWFLWDYDIFYYTSKYFFTAFHIFFLNLIHCLFFSCFWKKDYKKNSHKKHE